MSNESVIESVLGFMKEIETFKTCERTCRTTEKGRGESDAEHSWHLAVFFILLENEFEDIDSAKVLKMALIHDLPEIYAGDTNPYRGDTTDKEEKELKAADTLFSKLPSPVAGSLKALFDEYIKQKSLESRIVKSADKLMPLIQNLCTNDHHSSYRKLKVTYAEVKAYMDPYFSGGILESLYQRLLREACEKDVFWETREPAVDQREEKG